MANQASMVRRQRERARQQKRREKQAQRAERREQKKMAEQVEIPEDDPLNDPTIDWGSAVHETEVVLNDDLEVVEDPDETETTDED
jgi:sRNA-binding protein